MEFKNIEQLTITDCCNLLGLTRESLIDIVVSVNLGTSILHERIFNSCELTEMNEKIAQRLISLLLKDYECFKQCNSLQQFKNYLLIWEDGLWRNNAEKEIQRINLKDEERNYYNANNNSLKGLKKYLKKYPNGLYVSKARAGVKSISRNRCKIFSFIFTLCLIVLSIISYVNYYPAKYLSVNKQVVKFGKKGGTLHLSVSTNALGFDVYNDNSWIEIQQDGNDIEIKTGSNTCDFREAEIEIVAYSEFFGSIIGSKEKKIRITQDSGVATYIDIKEESSSNCQLEKGILKCYTFDYSWIHINLKTDGIEETVVKNINNVSWIEIEKRSKASYGISIQENSGCARECDLYVSSGVYKKILRIKQPSGLASYLDINKEKIHIRNEEHWFKETYTTGGFLTDDIAGLDYAGYRINIDCDGYWTVNNIPSWMIVYKYSINSKDTETNSTFHNNHITIFVKGNNLEERTAKLKVETSSGLFKEIEVLQNGVEM